MNRSWQRLVCALFLIGWMIGGCTGPPDEPDERDEPVPRAWSHGSELWPGAFLSASGTSSKDVWVVGARVGAEPTVMHWDGQDWELFDVDHDVDLWWVHATEEEVFFGGSDGAVIRFDEGRFTRFDSLGLLRHTVFGVWGEHDDLYAVGGMGSRNGFVWHYDGEIWRSLPLPSDVPLHSNGAMPGVFKVWGDGLGTVWFVGANGLVLRRVDDGPLERIAVDTDETLFTVHGHGQDVIAVGGDSQAVIVELSDSPQVLTLSDAPLLQGISVDADGNAWAVGGFGVIFHRHRGGEWERASPEVSVNVESLHAAFTDDSGALWTVGGRVLSPQLDRGMIVYHGHDAPKQAVAPELIEEIDEFLCPDDVVARGAEHSIARRWIEQNLQAIRLEIPEPGVHARNLFHLSATIYDTWAAFDPARQGVYVHVDLPDLQGSSLEAARDEAISFAAFTLLSHRYGNTRGSEQTLACLRRVMEDLGYDPEGGESTWAALGREVGLEIIEMFFHDGALEEHRYYDPDYEYTTPPLQVDDPGTSIDDPSYWQPLQLSQAVTQNGIPLDVGKQYYIGPHWKNVTPFAMERPAPESPYVTSTRNLSVIGNEKMKEWAVDVIKRTAWLDSANDAMMDISPRSYGNNSLGADDGLGHLVNPVTGEPYEAQWVRRSDFGRVLAEYWADGPNSETPPGHWNTLMHRVMDHPSFERRFFGQGEILDELTFDVHLYLILNGALHDAAIVAWEQKRLAESARPITLIRWMGARGQSSNPALPSYHPDGLPLVEGLIEVITEESSAPGERHEKLSAFVGEIAVFTWPGEPADHRNRTSPCVWVRAVDWIPYQPLTFVTPAFPGYVSGHSTFSRSAAEVIAGITGSPYFPGGLGEFVARKNEYLEFEQGPSQEVRLQWATYFDAADQAGQSRIWGGIHVVPDDYDGRRFGAIVGQNALQWARDRFFFE